MSMNPFAIFNAKAARPNMAAYQGGVPGAERLALEVPAALSMLERQGFHAVEMEWRVLAGLPFLLARDGSNADRKSVGEGKSVSVRVGLGGRRIIKKNNMQLLSLPFY